MLFYIFIFKLKDDDKRNDHASIDLKDDIDVLNPDAIKNISSLI